MRRKYPLICWHRDWRKARARAVGGMLLGFSAEPGGPLPPLPPCIGNS